MSGRSYLDEDAKLIRSLLSDDATPPPDSDALFRLYAVLMRAKGEQVTAADVHDAWAAWMLTSRDDHAAILPFDDLDERTRAEDEPYVDAIRRAARRRAGPT
jgi:hypothetical protein